MKTSRQNTTLRPQQRERQHPGCKTGPDASQVPYRSEDFPADYKDADLTFLDNVKILMASNPVKTDVNVIALCTEGTIKAKLNEIPFEAHRNCIFICPQGSSLSDVEVSTDFEYRSLGISSSLLQELLHNSRDIWNQAVYLKKIIVVEIEDKFAKIEYKLYEVLRACLDIRKDSQDSSFFPEVIKGLVHVTLIGLCDELRRKLSDTTRGSLHESWLFSKFLDLLQHRENKHQPVEYYASKLCVSSKYLTTVCKHYSGKSAGQWIAEYTISDITYYLHDTRLSIKEVANKVGFSNASFFGKYVKERLGCSPMEYRKKMGPEHHDTADSES
ncbi:MAG: helix-turn-helix domain-containing protein [Prevotella sp.]|jgi:AraC family transcriptional activator of pobA